MVSASKTINRPTGVGNTKGSVTFRMVAINTAFSYTTETFMNHFSDHSRIVEMRRVFFSLDICVYTLLRIIFKEFV